MAPCVQKSANMPTSGSSIGSLKFGFGALLVFAAFEPLATTLGNIRQGFTG